MVQNDFPYSVLPKKKSYRNFVACQNTVYNSTLQNFFHTVISYFSVLINLLNICSYAIANERFYNKMIYFLLKKIRHSSN